MGEFDALDQRRLHELREQALDRMRHAWYAAAWGGAIGTVLLLVIGVQTGEWRTVAPFLAGFATTVFLGHDLGRRHSQVAGALLVLSFVATIIGRWVETGQPGNLLGAALFGYFYVQGLRGAIDYAEIRKLYDNPGPPAP